MCSTSIRYATSRLRKWTVRFMKLSVRHQASNSPIVVYHCHNRSPISKKRYLRNSWTIPKKFAKTTSTFTKTSNSGKMHWPNTSKTATMQLASTCNKICPSHQIKLKSTPLSASVMRVAKILIVAHSLRSHNSFRPTLNIERINPVPSAWKLLGNRINKRYSNTWNFWRTWWTWVTILIICWVPPEVPMGREIASRNRRSLQIERSWVLIATWTLTRSFHKMTWQNNHT